MAPYVDQQGIRGGHREKRGLLLELGVVLAALAPVRALEVHHQRRSLLRIRVGRARGIGLGRARQPHPPRGLRPAALVVHLPERRAEHVVHERGLPRALGAHHRDDAVTAVPTLRAVVREERNEGALLQLAVAGEQLELRRARGHRGRARENQCPWDERTGRSRTRRASTRVPGRTRADLVRHPTRDERSKVERSNRREAASHQSIPLLGEKRRGPVDGFFLSVKKTRSDDRSTPRAGNPKA